MLRWTGAIRRAVVAAVRRVLSWPARVWAGLVALTQRPGARLSLHALAIVTVLGAAIYTGLYVVPSGASTRPAAAPGSAAPSTAPSLPAVDAPPADSPPESGSNQPDGTKSKRPQDALSTWADSLKHLDVPKVALQAYGYAELSMASTQPNCHLTWPTLAGIGRIESNHGRTGGATVREDGTSDPPVVGLRLDGGPDQMTIRDTDDGRIDGDTEYDRAVGAMQFIPSTWARWATDGDNDGKANPYDIDDAALAAARYLCAGGRDLATGEGWSAAIYSYNHLDAYVRDVFAAADQYGRMSRSGG